jgi:HlyD family secretion protein
MKRTWILLAASLLVLIGCGGQPEGTIFVSGRIDGDTVDISPKIAGRIAKLAVREGDSVTAGQEIAWLDSDQELAIRDTQKARIVSEQRTLDGLTRQLATYDEKVKRAVLEEDQAKTGAPAQVLQAEANLAVSKAELVRWQAELKQVQTDAQRYPPLAKSGAVAVQVAEQYGTREQVAIASVEASQKQVAASEAALEQAKAQLQQIPIKEADRLTLVAETEELKAQIASAEADVKADQAALRKIEADLADLTIHAPIAGTILTRSAEPGRVVQPGQTIFTMVDLTKLYLRGFVPEGGVGKIKVGQQAQVFLDSAPKEAIPSEVIRVDPQVMFTPENTYFQSDRVKQVMGLKLGLRGAYGLAKPGMPADGLVYIQGKPQTQGQAGGS